MGYAVGQYVQTPMGRGVVSGFAYGVVNVHMVDRPRVNIDGLMMLQRVEFEWDELKPIKSSDAPRESLESFMERKRGNWKAPRNGVRTAVPPKCPAPREGDIRVGDVVRIKEGYAGHAEGRLLTVIGLAKPTGYHLQDITTGELDTRQKRGLEQAYLTDEHANEVRPSKFSDISPMLIRG